MKLFYAIFLLLFVDAAYAQKNMSRDPLISGMLAAVSAANLGQSVRKLVSFQTRHTLSDTLSKTTGIGAARSWIKSEFESYNKDNGGKLQVSYDSFVQAADGRRILKPVVLKNVMAILPGKATADKRMLMVCGHYDSRVTDIMNSKGFAPGANDDASGVAGVLELARVMSNQFFDITIVFVAMVGEEQGLYGAAHLAKRAREEGWDVQLLLNNDMIGNTYGMETDLKDNSRVRVFSEGVPAAETNEAAQLRQSTGGENDGNARQAARYIKETGERYVDHLEVKLIYRKDRFLRGGDHTPFSAQGFTAVRITEMNEDFNRQHQDVRTEKGFKFGDLPEYVDYTYLQKITRLNLSVLANLGLAPAPPINPVLITSVLTNISAFKWTASAVGKDPAGYNILMRETTSPHWEKKFYFTATSAEIPYSKDNYLFGLQAVDANGHESLIVVPKPAK
ncbi:hypothetical protein AAKU52_000527 [Pedobacter sp. CG_S7]|uniref:M20/M25/M40 family metallo-hydrolase n=1 Tax=Pedobacter sp. CG_S7 TaxID=3143930 RepID=UPI003390D506